MNKKNKENDRKPFSQSSTYGNAGKPIHVHYKIYYFIYFFSIYYLSFNLLLKQYLIMYFSV